MANEKPNSLEKIIAMMAEGIKPAENITVSEFAEKHRYINMPGAYVGPWKNETTPYLKKPMDVLNSTKYTGMCFAGPAQSGKTDMVLNFLGHTVMCDPSDMMIIQTSQSTARDFTKRRIDKFHRHNPYIGSKLLKRRDADNTFDKMYSNGMILSLAWPSINELSGKPIRRLWITDYDRIPDDIDHEGSCFDLARKRATTFKRFGMTAVESSPGKEIENPKWMPSSPHEAPPCKGILSVYNRGDRQRWYWRCPHCGHRFEGDFNLLKWPDSTDIQECAHGCWVGCPACEKKFRHEDKFDLNLTGDWLIEGQSWDRNGKPYGQGRKSDIASFWLKGLAASFSSWPSLVFNYLTAEEEFKNTGNQQALKTTFNVDFALPYTIRGVGSERLPEDLKNRADVEGGRTVPPGVRFLIATIDVQKRRWEVQVHGVCPGGDLVVVDRFAIRKSERLDEDGDPWPVEPGAYLEDWDLIRKQVLETTYPLADESGRRMPIKLTGCDSGGEAGVTANAYSFYRKLRDEHPGLEKRFLLINPTGHPSAPRWVMTYPDSHRKDRFAGARKEIPVLKINTNIIKDTLDSMLDRIVPNGGMIRFAKDLPDSFYTELTVEVRTPKGWDNPKNLRNESWDLLVYCLALLLTPKIGIERINWESPPSWADDWDDNTLIIEKETDNLPFAVKAKKDYDLSQLGQNLT